MDWAAAAAKSRQSCPTLCDPIDGSPQAPPSLGFSRQEHWSGLPFPSPMHASEKWKESRSVVSDSATPWTAAYQAPPSMGFARQEYWSGVPLPSPMDWAGLQISNSKSNMQFSRQHRGTCLLVSIQFDAKWFFLSQEGRNIFYNQEKSLYYSWQLQSGVYVRQTK